MDSPLRHLPDAEFDDLRRDWIEARPGELFLTFEPSSECGCSDCTATITKSNRASGSDLREDRATVVVDVEPGE